MPLVILKIFRFVRNLSNKIISDSARIVQNPEHFRENRDDNSILRIINEMNAEKSEKGAIF
jgi:hypothetical protein